MTLKDVMAVILRYLTEIGGLGSDNETVVEVKSTLYSKRVDNKPDNPFWQYMMIGLFSEITENE